MTLILPSSDLRNKYSEIATHCHQSGEPVFLTKNGSGDLAVMSIEAYDRLAGLVDLRTMLDRGLQDIDNGRTNSAGEFFEKLDSELAK
ncbi:MAG: type II toxin-antitoxin system prevent-host-death family antitoxin [Deltaproteobacteria bacterium]|jgi:prevent-host-death family protein|nr:type II toxin-antitoxin system prevent-host-death family antitoxin [Deltaproteobacteria bacterium]